MDKVFDPISLDISNLFFSEDPIFKIPNYQRPYSWTDEQVETLWDDLFTAYSNNKEDKKVDTNYFLGSLIVVPDEKTKRILNVVDGQQRLTTLMILFNVIKDLYPNINAQKDDDSSIGIAKINVCIKDTNQKPRLRLETQPHNQNDFERIIVENKNFCNIKKPNKKQIESSTTHKYENTAYIFCQKLQTVVSNDIGDFVNYIFNNVKIIKISCYTTEFAIKLFQILNNRGLDLTPADLIKSQLLSQLENHKQEAFIEDWTACEKTVANLDINLTDMLTLYQYYLSGKNPKLSLSQELNNSFKNRDSNEIINDFKQFINKYENEIFLKHDKEIYSYYYLRWSTYWKAILLTALHSNYKDYKTLKSSLLRFYYLNWIAGKTLNAIKQISFKTIDAIKNKKPVEDIQSQFDEFLEKEKIIFSVLNNLNGSFIYNEPWMKPLLIRIEYNLGEDNFFAKIELSRDLHIEHILPQNYDKKKEWSHINKKDSEEYLHSGGNLTLLSGKQNIDAKNYSFKDKIKIYEGRNNNNGMTNFKISQNIVMDYNNNIFNQKWNIEAMEERYNWFVQQSGLILKINIDSILV